MKKLILSVAAAMLIFAIGCNKKDNDPKSVLMSFLDAIYNKDIEAAKKFATKGSSQMLDMMKPGMTASTDKKDLEEFNKDNGEFAEAKIDGDKAVVEVKDKRKGDATKYILKKEDGQWKVAFDKASMMEMAGDKMKAQGANPQDIQNMQNTADSLQNAAGGNGTMNNNPTDQALPADSTNKP